MTFPLLKDLVLFALAIYGAALSTWNLIQALRKDRRAIRVTVGTKIPTFTNGQTGDAWAHIEATNVGQRPVNITTIALEIANGRRLFSMSRNGRALGLIDTELPVTLADGQTARLHVAYVDIGQALMSHGITKFCELTPVCEDSAGGTHRGEPWKADPGELINM